MLIIKKIFELCEHEYLTFDDKKKCKMEHTKLKNESLNFFDSFSPPTTKTPYRTKIAMKK